MATETNTLRIVLDSRGALKNAEDLDRKLTQVEKTGIKASSSADALSASLKALAVYMGGIVTVSAAIDKIDAYTNLQNRLKLVTSSQQDLNKATQDTFRIAQQSYQAWDSVVQVYQRFSDNAKTLNISMDQTARLTETVSKAVAVSGASAQAADAALTQFGQALASGVLRGEELNSVLEQTPALAKAIAQGMGITVGQLRSVAAEGKITGDVLVDALTKAGASVDELFDKTDITIGQSFTLLANELQKFVGEAATGSGAATALAESIKFLSQNLSLIADAAVVGGIALLAKSFASKAIAVQASVAATLAERAATAAQTQASIAATTAQVNEAKAHLANVQATNAATQAKFGATAAAIRYKQASDAVTAALAAQTAAQTGLNAATTLGSRALALVGGPVGAITIGVGALAAGYMYLQNRTAEANAKLEEQGRIASKTNAELEKLAGNDKVSAVRDLTTAFNSQNESLSKSKEAVDAVLFAIRASSVENERARKITEDARNGVISYTDAIKLLNNEKISVDLYNKLKDQADQYDENSIKAGNTQRALAALKVEVNLAGNAMQDAANKAIQKSEAMDRDANSTTNAANANRDYINSLQAGDIAKAARTIISKGYSPEVAKELATLAVKNGKVTREEANAILYKNKQQVALNETIQQYQKLNDPNAAEKANKARKKAESQAAKEAERLEKERTRIAEQQYQMREDIAYRYADRNKKIETDLANEIKQIQEANFSPKDTSGFIENAKRRAMLERELYQAQLAAELNDWQDTEEQKLDRKVLINELLIQLDADMNDDVKQQAMKSLLDRSNQEIEDIKLARDQRILAYQEAGMTDIELMLKRYELELREIAKIKDAREKAAATEGAARGYVTSYEEKKKAAQDNLNQTLGQLGGFGEYVSLQKQMEDQAAVLEKAREFNLISEQEYKNALLEIEENYINAKMDLNLQYGQNILGSTSSIFKTLLGEQSAFYKVTFAAEKAFNIARSLIAIKTGIAQAAALPFPANLGAIASVAAATAGIVADIQSIGQVGFKTGGYTGSGGVNDVAGVVHGQEYVFDAAATRRIGVDNLEAIRSGAPVVGSGGINVSIVNNGTPQTYDVQQMDENSVRIIAVDAVSRAISQPNSDVSKALQNNLMTGRRR